jgi:hypothetical protein
MRLTPVTLRVAWLLIAFTAAACAGDFVNHRFDLPGATAERLEVRDASGAIVKIITDRPTIQAFDAAVDRIDRRFDDIWDKSGVAQYRVELLGSDGMPVGSLTVSAKYIRYIPGKGAAKINTDEHELLLRILGLPAVPQRKHGV